MPSVSVLPKTNVNPGTYQSSPLAIPQGAVRIAVTAVLTDTQILTEGTALLLVLQVSRDGGANWDGFAQASWNSGPNNAPRTPGNPPPRPGTGTISIPSGATHVRGEVGVSTAGDVKLSIGAQVDYN